jgi:hypothetical protein
MFAGLTGLLFFCPKIGPGEGKGAWRSQKGAVVPGNWDIRAGFVFIYLKLFDVFFRHRENFP